MPRLLLSIVTLVMAISIGCTAISPSPSPTSGPERATATSTPAPASAVEPLPGVTPEEFFLTVSRPEVESVVNRSPFEVRGSTLVDAVVTVNGDVIEVGPQGEFTASVELEEGPNSIEVIASDFAGHEESRVIPVIYVP